MGRHVRGGVGGPHGDPIAAAVPRRVRTPCDATQGQAAREGPGSHRTVVSRTEPRSQPRARLLFALAHVLDAGGDYPRAAARLSEANALNLELRRAEGVVYRPDDNERFVGRLIEAFSLDFFQRTAGLGLETRRPVFIFGLPRSGTTLVEQILASHPRIYGAGERMFGRRSFEKAPFRHGPIRPSHRLRRLAR